MRRALVTTTINAPTLQLAAWFEQLRPGDLAVVVGDVQSPHTQLREFLARHEHIGTQYVEGPDSSWSVDTVIGARTIQRRNIGFLRAVQLAPNVNYIVTVDDDNEPDQTWFRDVNRIMTDQWSGKWISGQGDWANPGTLSDPETVHRGFPLSIGYAHRMDLIRTSRSESFTVGVFASIITGDPDISAIERLLLRPDIIQSFDSAGVMPEVKAPFNTQATAFRRELMPAMHLWLGVGRYDDIFASYVTGKVMKHLGWCRVYGSPTAYQDRNEHDVLKDLEQEMFGYRHCERIVEVIDSVKPFFAWDGNVADMTRAIFTEVISECGDILPDQTVDGFLTWMHDVEGLERDYGPSLFNPNWSDSPDAQS